MTRIAIMDWSRGAAVLTIAAALVTAGCTVRPPPGQFGQTASVAPPPTRVEVVPPPPSERVVWVPGHWAWDGSDYAWEPGHYVERPSARAEFEPGHWVQTANGWTWLREWVSSGRFRPGYLPGGTATGRWVTHGGGALQIPKVIRRAVIADPGWRLVVADASQLEPRILAAISRDPGLMEVAGQDTDLYKSVSDRAFSGDRAQAKLAVRFGTKRNLGRPTEFLKLSGSSGHEGLGESTGCPAGLSASRIDACRRFVS